MAGQKSTRRGKAHREAFPAFDILEADRSRRGGGGACTWFDERGQIIGQGELAMLDSQQAVFRYEFFGSANIDRSTGIITVAVSGTWRNLVHIRRSFHCPSCFACVQKLFFVSTVWACGSCHGLVFLKQRLGAINKKIVSRDEMLAELRKLPASQHSTRRFYNLKRHIEKINSDLAAAVSLSLPQELLYRTYSQWAASGVIVKFGNKLPTGDRPNEQGRGFACLPRAEADLGPLETCELIGVKVLHRPAVAFLQQHKAKQFVALEHDIVAGLVRFAPNSRDDLASLLAERLVLRPLMLTSGWSVMSEASNGDGRTECGISAIYEGDPMLWPIGPVTKVAKNPVRALLDDKVVTLQVRLPMNGKADPRTDLLEAAARLEAELARVRAKFDDFNVTRGAAAQRLLRTVA
ncbi:hypothetical protein [Sphingomonas faeni]|uniref:hypothetical protein n=1 Tax=Sphingomonas faeni TaxID=185950 RepID=UPI0024136587|nr:hypothetical protein [Sphingomonas faeni]